MRFLLWFLGYSVYFSAIIYVFNLLITNFLSCPYPDFLSWDGDLRAVTSLKLLSSIQTLEFSEVFRLLLDTPTWPILRNLLQVILYSLSGENGTVDTLLTTGSLFLFLAILPFIYLSTIRDFEMDKYLKTNIESGNRSRFSGFGIYYSLFFSFVLFLTLILSNNYILYTFSPMLEIQGSVLTFLFIFFFYKYIVDKTNIKIPILFAFLCLLTKYPYGYLVILFLIFFQFIFYFNELQYSLMIFFSWILHKKVVLFALAFCCFFILLSFFNLQGKLSFYFRYFSIIGIFTILLVFFWKTPSIPKKIREIELFFILPMILFILSHPDRVSSSSGTISHAQIDGVMVGSTFLKDWNYYSIFFKTLFIELPEHDYFSPILILLFMGSFLPLLKKKVINNPKSLLIKFPYITFSLFILVSLFGLTLLTPNHQSRHVYHLYPSFIFCCTMVLLDLFYFLSTLNGNIFNSPGKTGNLPEKSNNILKVLSKDFFPKILYFVVLVILPFIPVFNNFNKKLSENFSNTYLCFGGILSIYETPIEFQKELPELLTKNSILLNGIEENNLNRADVELVFSREAFKKKIQFGIGEREFYRRKNTFESAILVSRNCSNDKYKFIKDKTVLHFLKEETVIMKPGVCVSLYTILP